MKAIKFKYTKEELLKLKEVQDKLLELENTNTNKDVIEKYVNLVIEYVDKYEHWEYNYIFNYPQKPSLWGTYTNSDDTKGDGDSFVYENRFTIALELLKREETSYS